MLHFLPSSPPCCCTRGNQNGFRRAATRIVERRDNSARCRPRAPFGELGLCKTDILVEGGHWRRLQRNARDHVTWRVATLVLLASDCQREHHATCQRDHATTEVTI